jgi:MFS transporter, DHA1 family, tetracycline resistance protein
LTFLLPAVAQRRAALAFILVTVCLDMLALGMIAPVLPGLVAAFLGGDTARAAEVFGVFGTAWQGMQFFFSSVLGTLSDRFGRRPIILLSNLGLGIDYLVMAVAPTLGWLFVGRVLSGITSASIPTAVAYIADVTPPERRAAGFGMISAAFGVGFIIGPAFGGLLGTVNPRLPFWVAAGLSLANALYGLFVLPESLAAEHRSPFSWRRANPMGGFELLTSHRSLIGLSTVVFLGVLAHQVLQNVYVLYTQYRYGWTDRTVGLSLALIGVCSGIVGGLLVKPAVKHLRDRNTLLLGIMFGALGFWLFGHAARGLWFWIGIPALSLWGLAGPAAQGLMTQHVLSSEQGQLQGAINSLNGLAGLLGPGLFTVIFAQAIGKYSAWHLPGAPFYVSAFLLACSFLVARVLSARTQDL